MVAAVRCAPPANKPTIAERDTCAPWLAAELALVAELRSWSAWAASPGRRCGRAALGRVRACPGRARRSATAPRSRLTGRTATRPSLLVLGCYHPSQQNTFTGRVTEPMLDDVFARARHHQPDCSPAPAVLGLTRLLRPNSPSGVFGDQSITKGNDKDTMVTRCV